MMIASLRATAVEAALKPLRWANLTPQALRRLHFLLRVSILTDASNSRLRNAPLPHLLMPPDRSTSPEAYLRGVSPI